MSEKKEAQDSYELSQEPHSRPPRPTWSNVQFKFLKQMKKLKYVFALAVLLMAASCSEENIMPRGEDDPIAIPPPPPPPDDDDGG